MKRQFLQGFCSGGCHAGTWRLSMTDGCGPFRGPRRPLSICKNFLSCQLPARTNVNQCVSFSTEIIFFSFCKKSFSDGVSLTLLVSLGRCRSTGHSDTVEGDNCSVTLPHPLLGSGLYCMQDCVEQRPPTSRIGSPQEHPLQNCVEALSLGRRSP